MSFNWYYFFLLIIILILIGTVYYLIFYHQAPKPNAPDQSNLIKPEQLTDLSLKLPFSLDNENDISLCRYQKEIDTYLNKIIKISDLLFSKKDIIITKYENLKKKAKTSGWNNQNLQFQFPEIAMFKLKCLHQPELVDQKYIINLLNAEINIYRLNHYLAQTIIQINFFSDIPWKFVSQEQKTKLIQEFEINLYFSFQEMDQAYYQLNKIKNNFNQFKYDCSSEITSFKQITSTINKIKKLSKKKNKHKHKKSKNKHKHKKSHHKQKRKKNPEDVFLEHENPGLIEIQ